MFVLVVNFFFYLRQRNCCLNIYRIKNEVQRVLENTSSTTKKDDVQSSIPSNVFISNKINEVQSNLNNMTTFSPIFSSKPFGKNSNDYNDKSNETDTSDSSSYQYNEKNVTDSISTTTSEKPKYRYKQRYNGGHHIHAAYRCRIDEIFINGGCRQKD